MIDKSREFEASRFLVRKSKKLKANFGILPETIAKRGKDLPQATVDKVIAFYNSDINSRVMPGIKDAISLKVNGERISMQKRLILLPLNELFVSFKESEPGCKISYSKLISRY